MLTFSQQHSTQPALAPGPLQDDRFGDLSPLRTVSLGRADCHFLFHLLNHLRTEAQSDLSQAYPRSAPSQDYKREVSPPNWHSPLNYPSLESTQFPSKYYPAKSHTLGGWLLFIPLHTDAPVHTALTSVYL